MIATLFRQVERYQVDRHRKANGVYAWVTVGFFNAHSPAEARRLARNAMANRICFLRAYPVGREMPALYRTATFLSDCRDEFKEAR